MSEPRTATSALHPRAAVADRSEPGPRNRVRPTHQEPFATKRAAGLFIVVRGWSDFAVYETCRLPEVLRE